MTSNSIDEVEAAVPTYEGEKSFSSLKSLLSRYTLVGVARGRVLDSHPDFTIHGGSEHAAYLDSIISGLQIGPLRGGSVHPKAKAKAKQSRDSEAVVQLMTPERRSRLNQDEDKRVTCETCRTSRTLPVRLQGTSLPARITCATLGFRCVRGLKRKRG